MAAGASRVNLHNAALPRNNGQWGKARGPVYRCPGITCRPGPGRCRTQGRLGPSWAAAAAAADLTPDEKNPASGRVKVGAAGTIYAAMSRMRPAWDSSSTRSACHGTALA